MSVHAQVVGNFFRVLSVVGNIFCRLIASRLTPFTPSSKIILSMCKICSLLVRSEEKELGLLSERDVTSLECEQNEPTLKQFEE